MLNCKDDLPEVERCASLKDLDITILPNTKILRHPDNNNNNVFHMEDNVIYGAKTSVMLESKTIDIHYLLGILNSCMTKYQLHKICNFVNGQEWNQQRIKLLKIPEGTPEQQLAIKTMIEYILFLFDSGVPRAIYHTANIRLIVHFYNFIDKIIYEIFFKEHMKEIGLEAFKYFEQTERITKDMTVEKKLKIISDFYHWAQQSDNRIRQIGFFFETRSQSLLYPINSRYVTYYFDQPKL